MRSRVAARCHITSFLVVFSVICANSVGKVVWQEAAEARRRAARGRVPDGVNRGAVTTPLGPRGRRAAPRTALRLFAELVD